MPPSVVVLLQATAMAEWLACLSEDYDFGFYCMIFFALFVPWKRYDPVCCDAVVIVSWNAIMWVYEIVAVDFVHAPIGFDLDCYQHCYSSYGCQPFLVILD